MDSTTTGTITPHALNEAVEVDQTVRQYYLEIENQYHANLAGLEKARAMATAKGLLDVPINTLRALIYPGNYPF